MLLTGLHMAHAEQDGESGHHERDDEGGVEPSRQAGADHTWSPLAGTVGVAGEGREAEGDRLKLKRQIGHGADHRDQRGQHRDAPAAAVARAEEVGDGGDVLALRHGDDAAHQRQGEHHHHGGADIDQREIEAAGDRTADRPVEGPGGAVDRQRERIDDRPESTARPAQGMALAEMRNGEEQAEVGQRESENDVAEGHFRQLTHRLKSLSIARQRATTKVWGSICRGADYQK